MHRELIALALVAIVAAGCSAAGVPVSSDPYTKIDQANYLLTAYEPLNRPLPAERLIWDSIQIFEEQGDERGLAVAYGAYAGFLYSGAVENWESHYRENGFRDESVTFNNRKEKSIEYYEMQKDLCLKANSYDCVSNAYFNLGSIYHHEGKAEAACDAFEKCLECHLIFRKDHPGEEIELPSGFTSFPEYIEAVRQEAGCEWS